MFFFLTFLTYAVVGALVASRRPRNPVGWLFCAVGVYFAGSEALYAYARDPSDAAGSGGRRLGARRGRASPPPWPSCCSSCCSRRGISCPAAGGSPASARSWPRPYGPWRSRSIPVRCARSTASRTRSGIDGAGAVLDPIAGFGPVVLLGCILLAVGGAVARFRRARARERQQLKWLALGAAYLVAVLLAMVVLLLLVDTDQGVWDFVSALLICSGIAALPVAAAVAILRERLYDIDVVINRALVYGALTATLGGAYLAIVLVVGLAIGESDVAVAGSTLAVAALFRPARARIQAAVDRHFFRRRYDATQTLAGFGARLRDEVELECAEQRAAERRARDGPAGPRHAVAQEPAVKRLAWGLCAVCGLLTAAGLAFAAVNETAPVNTLGSPEFDALFSVVYLAFPVVGALIASRQPRNAIGWLFLVAGLGRAIDFAFVGYATAPTGSAGSPP